MEILLASLSSDIRQTRKEIVDNWGRSVEVNLRKRDGMGLGEKVVK